MDSYWAKVLFKDFIKHYRKMTDEQKAADVDESMDAIENNSPDGNSFGAKMVQWANDRIARNHEKNLANGLKGGRPRLGASTKQATEQQPVVKPRPLKPPSVQQLYDFCADNSIDEAYAREWYEMCSDRQWKDRAMKPIENWKGALVNYVKNKQTS